MTPQIHDHRNITAPSKPAPIGAPAGDTGDAELRFATRAVTTEPDPTTGALLTPIHASTTYAQTNLGEHLGFTYSRSGNPTVSALEQKLGELESAEPAVCFSSGMAAISALLLSRLGAGDRVVCGDVVYGGTVRLLREILEPLGVEVEFVDATDIAGVERALAKPTRLLFVETPANPTLVLCDLRALAELAHGRGAELVVDGTFLTPALQRPLDLGADWVVHSTTKYLEGHNATLGGAVLSRDEGSLDALRRTRNTLGSIPSPHDAWLTLRGLKTLPLRMKRHSESARVLAKFLETRAEVRRVAHPELSSFPQRELAERQQASGGGLVTFELEGGLDAVRRFVPALRRIHLAENLGAAESLITHSATMTHGDLGSLERERLGITDGLLRLSVGLEDVRDLQADLAWALDSIGGSRG